jgi:hypothetical protein
VCWRIVTWSFCIFSDSFANMRDLRGRCFIKLTMFTVISRTCFKSSPIVLKQELPGRGSSGSLWHQGCFSLTSVTKPFIEPIIDKPQDSK